MCVKPLEAYRDGSGTLFFWKKDGCVYQPVPCGQCVECRLKRSREWAVRCMNEASLHRENCFITLTYRDNPVSLRYRDFQLFMKRLIKAVGPVRFYMCGEYGEENGRPHYHALLFGYNFADRQYWRSRNGLRCYRSALLEALWPLGNSEIGSVTFESAAYVARYIMKKVTGDAAAEHYRVVVPETGEVVDRVPEFCHMSLRPGIGAGFVRKYWSDVFPDGKMMARGVEVNAARYYDKLYRRWDSDSYDFLKWRRVQAAMDNYAENRPHRLRVRELLLNQRTRSFKRSV